jgi:hypothetical protein
VLSDSIQTSFGPPGGSEEALNLNSLGEVAPLDVVSLDIQSRGQEKPIAERNGTDNPPTPEGEAQHFPRKPTEQVRIYRGQPCRGHSRKSLPLI